jgi:hypothetical protein
MNPNEAWIGKVLFVGIVAVIIWAVKSLFKK